MKVRKFGVAKASNRVLLASLVEEIQQNLFKFNKNSKNPFRCLKLLQSQCAKWFWRVFKNEFLRHAHNTYHVTALLQTFESKNIGLESLKNHCRVKYTCDPLGVQPQDPKILKGNR